MENNSNQSLTDRVLGNVTEVLSNHPLLTICTASYIGGLGLGYGGRILQNYHPGAEIVVPTIGAAADALANKASMWPIGYLFYGAGVATVHADKIASLITN